MSGNGSPSRSGAVARTKRVLSNLTRKGSFSRRSSSERLDSAFSPTTTTTTPTAASAAAVDARSDLDESAAARSPSRNGRGRRHRTEEEKRRRGGSASATITERRRRTSGSSSSQGGVGGPLRVQQQRRRAASRSDGDLSFSSPNPPSTTPREHDYSNGLAVNAPPPPPPPPPIPLHAVSGYSDETTERGSSLEQPDPLVRTRTRRYVKKTSIVQHSFVSLDTSFTFDGYGDHDHDNGDGDCYGGSGGKTPESCRSDRSSPSNGAAAARGRGRKKNADHRMEKEAIECVFTHMSFNDDDDDEERVKQEAQQQSPNWFALHADPTIGQSFADEEEAAAADAAHRSSSRNGHRGSGVGGGGGDGWRKDANSNGTGGSRVTTDVVGREEAPLYARGRVVHVADIVTTENNFSKFLEAYEELSRRYYAKECSSTSLKDIAVVTTAASGGGGGNEKGPAEESINAVGSCSITPRDGIPCSHCAAHPHRELPPVPPEYWPQRPLLLRATPGSGTTILGIRYSGSKAYLQTPWPNALNKEWAEEPPIPDTADGYRCPQCQILPINDGTEPVGKSLVIDFETRYFVGTVLMRIRDSEGTSPRKGGSMDMDRNMYFDHKERKYQAVIRGRFKHRHKMTECVTGQAFSRPCGNLPSRWILKSAVQIVSLFAPQLQANLDGSSVSAAATQQDDGEGTPIPDGTIPYDGPSFLSPLASTPQTVISQIDGDTDVPVVGGDVTDCMERSLEEPYRPNDSLVCQYHAQRVLDQKTTTTSTSGKKNKAGSSITLPPDAHKMSSQSRAKLRKKLFDKLYSKSDEVSEFETDKVYTFEFLQHLVNFQAFRLDVGNVGSMNLQSVLLGQPLKSLGAFQGSDHGRTAADNLLHCFWSFDIWHEGLYPDALEHDRRKVEAAAAALAAGKKWESLR